MKKAVKRTELEHEGFYTTTLLFEHEGYKSPEVIEVPAEEVQLAKAEAEKTAMILYAKSANKPNSIVVFDSDVESDHGEGLAYYGKLGLKHAVYSYNIYTQQEITASLVDR